MGMAEIDGKEYAHIRLEEEIVLNIFLDPETALPEVTTWRQFNPQLGGNIDIKMVSSDWTEGGGVTLAHQTVVYHNGEAGSTTIKIGRASCRGRVKVVALAV